jgi:CcmD family protein
MGYLFAAYTLIWAVVFGYVFVLYLRQRRLLRDIELLKENLNTNDSE